MDKDQPATANTTETPGGTLALLPGVALALGLAAAAMALRAASGIGALSPMIVAVAAGLLIGTVLRLPAKVAPGLGFAMRPLLRLGIILLGFQVTLQQIAALGIGAFAACALTLVAAYVAVRMMGRLMGVAQPLATLIAAGTAVCGASAIIAANSVARGSQEDVAYALASVTLFGTLAIFAAPLLAPFIGLDGAAYGLWVGATIHEVAQVTAAAFQLGPEAGQAGTVAKLTRVVLLAPLVLAMALAARVPGDAAASVPVPWFVLGFAAVMTVNSLIDLPAMLPALAAPVTTLLLAAGLAAMGLTTDLRRLRAKGAAPLLLSAFGWVFISAAGWLLLRLLAG